MRAFKFICAGAICAAALGGCKSQDITPEIFTLKNSCGATATFTNYGATLMSMMMPAADGTFKEVVWKLDSIEECMADGCCRQPVIGRFANRIGKASFTLDGKEYKVTVNENANHLHGGKGFHKRVWNAKQTAPNAVEMTYFSPDGEEGYPGNFTVKAVFTLTDANELDMKYTATTDAPTIVNLTAHTYFNLTGEKGKSTKTHMMRINADRYTVVDKELIPTGELAPVDGTKYDLRTAIPVDQFYDTNFVLNSEDAVELYEPSTGIKLNIVTDQPGIQVFTGLPDGGVALEAQHFPDSPNHADFPSCVLRPGETYTQHTVYKFSVMKYED